MYASANEMFVRYMYLFVAGRDSHQLELKARRSTLNCVGRMERVRTTGCPRVHDSPVFMTLAHPTPSDLPLCQFMFLV